MSTAHYSKRGKQKLHDEVTDIEVCAAGGDSDRGHHDRSHERNRREPVRCGYAPLIIVMMLLLVAMQMWTMLENTWSGAERGLRGDTAGEYRRSPNPYDAVQRLLVARIGENGAGRRDVENPAVETKLDVTGTVAVHGVLGGAEIFVVEVALPDADTASSVRPVRIPTSGGIPGLRIALVVSARLACLANDGTLFLADPAFNSCGTDFNVTVSIREHRQSGLAYCDLYCDGGCFKRFAWCRLHFVAAGRL